MGLVVSFDRSPFTDRDVSLILSLVDELVQRGVSSGVSRHTTQGVDAFGIYGVAEKRSEIAWAVIRQKDGKYLLIENHRMKAQGRTVESILGVLM